MKRHLSMLAIGVLSAAICSVAAAQTPSTSTDHPTPIGTSQQTADKANSKAVQEGRTATVVRTGPSAADRVRGATTSARNKAKRSRNATQNNEANPPVTSTSTSTNTNTNTTTAKP